MSEEAEVEQGGALMLWFAKPVTYQVYQDEVTELCKLEFGNVLRAQLTMAKWHGLLYWIFGWLWAWSYAGYFFIPEYYETSTFKVMDTAYECLQRSEAPNFTQENFDSEYWFQKGYIIQFADSMQMNPTPTFVGANLKEMETFWTDMMAFYDIPEVAPAPMM